MKLHQLLTTGALVLSLSLAAGSAVAQSDKAKKQAEVVAAAQTSLQEFYKAKPELKAMVEKAPGYAVFTTYGLSFLVGGAGGKGVVHDNKTKKNVFMDMAQASAGLQAGIAESKMLIVFDNPKSLTQFVDSGWEVGAGGGAGAAVQGKGASGGGGSTVVNDSNFFVLTRNGLQAGGAVAGTKFWKDKELN
jgi:lipid-binding SYLF domain-containing protein